MLAIAVAVAASCGGAPSEEADDLCHDLDNLRGTIDFLATPRSDVDVGLVRSAVAKLEPTFIRAGGSESVPDVIGVRLVGAQEAYAAVLEPYGDDEPITTVRVALAPSARRLTDAVAEVEAALGCDGR